MWVGWLEGLSCTLFSSDSERLVLSMNKYPFAFILFSILSYRLIDGLGSFILKAFSCDWLVRMGWGIVLHWEAVVHAEVFISVRYCDPPMILEEAGSPSVLWQWANSPWANYFICPRSATPCGLSDWDSRQFCVHLKETNLFMACCVLRGQCSFEAVGWSR